MAVRRTAGWGLAQRCVDRGENPFEVSIDVIIPEPQNSESLLRKILVADSIALRVNIDIMLSAVDLDDQSMFQTDEVHDKAISWSQTAKVITSLAP